MHAAGLLDLLPGQGAERVSSFSRFGRVEFQKLQRSTGTFCGMFFGRACDRWHIRGWLMRATEAIRPPANDGDASARFDVGSVYMIG